MDCKYCTRNCRRSGKRKNGIQRDYCGLCGKYQQAIYRNKAYEGRINHLISDLVCEGVGIRGIGRVLKIATVGGPKVRQLEIRENL